MPTIHCTDCFEELRIDLLRGGQLTLAEVSVSWRPGRIPPASTADPGGAPISSKMELRAQRGWSGAKQPAGLVSGGEIEQPAASRGAAWVGGTTWWWRCCPMKGAGWPQGRTQQTWIWPCSPAW